MARRGRWRLIPSTSDRPFLRTLLLAGVFVLVMLAFWLHFERRMELLRGTHIQNPDQALTAAQSRELAARRTLFRDGLGLEVIVRVEKNGLSVPLASSPALFVGVGLGNGDAVVILPPLARKALGEHGEGKRLAVEERLAACIRQQPPGPCLAEALDALWLALRPE